MGMHRLLMGLWWGRKLRIEVVGFATVVAKLLCCWEYLHSPGWRTNGEVIRASISVL